jgi:hypothetical protein
MNQQNHGSAHVAYRTIALRVGGCDAGTTVPQKKEPGTLANPSNLSLPRIPFLTPSRSGAPGRGKLVFSLSHDITSPLDCVLLNDDVMCFVRLRSFFRAD